MIKTTLQFLCISRIEYKNKFTHRRNIVCQDPEEELTVEVDPAAADLEEDREEAVSEDHAVAADMVEAPTEAEVLEAHRQDDRDADITAEADASVRLCSCSQPSF